FGERSGRLARRSVAAGKGLPPACFGVFVRLMESKTIKRMAELSSPMSKSLFKKILVALDGSESSQKAAQAALELAEKLKADLLVLHAISPPATYYRSTIASPTGMSLPTPSQHEI